LSSIKWNESIVVHGETEQNGAEEMGCFKILYPSWTDCRPTTWKHCCDGTATVSAEIQITVLPNTSLTCFYCIYS